MKITLPPPPKELSPNARPHHMSKAKKVKQYRGDAALACKAVGVPESCPWDAATIQVRWFHKTLRYPDKDNIIAWLKSAFDGMADAGLVADDRDVTYLPVSIEKDAADPRVEIEIREGT